MTANVEGFINLQIRVIIHGRNSDIKFPVITEVLQTNDHADLSSVM
jgi:hypothetical protein